MLQRGRGRGRERERESQHRHYKVMHFATIIITTRYYCQHEHNMSNLDATPAFLFSRDMWLSPYLLEHLLLLRAHVTRALQLLLSLQGHEAVQLSQLNWVTLGCTYTHRTDKNDDRRDTIIITIFRVPSQQLWMLLQLAEPTCMHNMIVWDKLVFRCLDLGEYFKLKVPSQQGLYM